MSKTLSKLEKESYILLNQGKFKEALTISDKVLEKDPENLVALNIKVDSLFMLEKFEEALEISNKILAKNAENLKALCDSGFASFKLNRRSIR